MKKLSTLGWCYAAFCGMTCGWFCLAAINGWKGPQANLQSNSYSGSGSSYSSSRSWGGSWGGGK